MTKTLLACGARTNALPVLEPLLILIAAGVCLCPSSTRARDEIEPAITRGSRPDDAVPWLASVEGQVDANTTLSVGDLYLGGLRTAAPFVLVDRQLGGPSTGHARYFHAIHHPDRGEDRSTGFVRLGATHQVTRGQLSLENRLLYEAVLDAQGRDDGTRLRYRARMTVNIKPAASLKPRLFVYSEPILDDRSARPSRIDFAAGAGAMLSRQVRVDAYALRQQYLHQPQATANAVVLEVRVRVSSGTAPS